jgi:hypothetical protein
VDPPPRSRIGKLADPPVDKYGSGSGSTPMPFGESARVAGAATAVAGALFGVYLLVVPLVVIDALCHWCLARDIVLDALAVVCLLRLRVRTLAGNPY